MQDSGKDDSSGSEEEGEDDEDESGEEDAQEDGSNSEAAPLDKKVPVICLVFVLKKTIFWSFDYKLLFLCFLGKKEIG